MKRRLFDELVKPYTQQETGANVYAGKEDVMARQRSLASQALARIGKDWSKSSLTREELLSSPKEFASYVAKAFGLERIDNLKPGHLQFYVLNPTNEGWQGQRLF